MTVSKALRASGFDVVPARDGPEGIALFRQCAIDLVITDVRMPGLSGPEVLRALQAIRPGVPAIVMGGSGSIPSNGAQAFARQAGADRAFHKPFSIPELVGAISELLGAPRVGQEA